MEAEAAAAKEVRRVHEYAYIAAYLTCFSVQRAAAEAAAAEEVRNECCCCLAPRSNSWVSLCRGLLLRLLPLIR